MSNSLISLNPDLSRLRDEGYEIEIVSNHLVVRNVPYINADKQIRRGTLVSVLDLAGDTTVTPSTHIIMFAGEMPCDINGNELNLVCDSTPKKIGTDITVNYGFSRKPPNGYPDYHAKITAYVTFLSSHAQALDPDATAQTWRIVPNVNTETPFQYLDTASSRAGLTALNKKLEHNNIAIVGLGGTGSYTLDLVAKTPIQKIHLFDGDKFGQHNAFRSPGAASLDELRTIPYKVDYLTGIYGRIHRGIVPHRVSIGASNVDLLREMEFVFICADAGSAKQVLIERLEEWGIPFIDTGMGLDLIDNSLHGTLTVTTSTPTQRAHFRRRVSLSGDGHENIYAKNIQVADLNALNAALAVIRWKKLCGFYTDLRKEHFSSYTIEGNSMVSEDKI